MTWGTFVNIDAIIMQIWCNHNAYHIWGWHTFLLLSTSGTLYFLPGSSIYSNHNRFRRIWNGTISTSLLFVLKIEIFRNDTISNNDVFFVWLYYEVTLLTSFIFPLNDVTRLLLSIDPPDPWNVAPPATGIPPSSWYGGSGGRRDSGGESVYT